MLEQHPLKKQLYISLESSCPVCEKMNINPIVTESICDKCYDTMAEIERAERMIEQVIDYQIADR